MNKKYAAALAAFFTVMYVLTFAEHYCEATKIANVDTCTIERQKLGERSYHCITLDAVHKDARDNTFVYLVKEKHSILGNELVCTMRYIDILAKDDAYAALNTGDSSLTESDLVILHSDRELSQGSKIRLLE